MKNIIVVCILVLSFSCNRKETNNPGTENMKRADMHSFAKPSEAFVTHLVLDLKVDFQQKKLSGKASWNFQNPGKADSLILDTRDLDIEKITAGNDERELGFTLAKADSLLGSRLAIAIDSAVSTVNIYYNTSPGAAALQWLEPQQTAGKKQPFLFTQSQAILARTWIPSQDGPGIKFTYEANITVPANLLALMSAGGNPQQKNPEGIYHFKQEHPIPSYLMALAVGDIAFKSVDNRTGVYAETVSLDKAAWEFQDMGKMVTAAEKIYGPYRWGRYDLLVLPPSFPFGGMENPMLTFATPTVIAGDRSLVSLVAHELAHSWSGNLVTNASWNDFWLNEGFTTYFERRIIESIYGIKEKEMQEVLGLQDLKDEMKDFGENNPDTKLKVNLDGRDPDLGVSSIAYEKGYLFLKKIEEVTGRNAFDSFINTYFNEHAFRSITTEQFLDYLKKNLLRKEPSWKDSINIQAWVYEPGIPENIPSITSMQFNLIDSLIEGWKRDRVAKGLRAKLSSTNEKLYFLRHLPETLTRDDMMRMDEEFNFTQSHNAEVQDVWYMLAIRHNYTAADPAIENFLINVGRRKFLTPLYKEFLKTPEGKKKAKAIYEKARPNYHSVSTKTLDELFLH